MSANNTILLMYRRPGGKRERFMRYMSTCGEFTHVEIYIPQQTVTSPGSPCQTGWTYTNFSMCNMMHTRCCLASYVYNGDIYMFHPVKLTPGKMERLCEWSNTQVKNHCMYNFKDLAMQIMPAVITHMVKDVKTVYPNRLYCSQATILALRYAAGRHVPASNNTYTELLHVCDTLSHMNTRLSTPTGVCNAITTRLGNPLSMSAPNPYFTHLPYELRLDASIQEASEGAH
jgi:hypothetical protein